MKRWSFEKCASSCLQNEGADVATIHSSCSKPARRDRGGSVTVSTSEGKMTKR
jgi:hypothetical protein